MLEYRIRSRRLQLCFGCHFRGVTNGAQAAYSVMKRQGFGRIVNTASIAGLMATREWFQVGSVRNVQVRRRWLICQPRHRGSAAWSQCICVLPFCHRHSNPQERVSMARIRRIFQMRSWRSFGRNTTQWIPKLFVTSALHLEAKTGRLSLFHVVHGR
jgi:hypothetical protein